MWYDRLSPLDLLTPFRDLRYPVNRILAAKLSRLLLTVHTTLNMPDCPTHFGSSSDLSSDNRHMPWSSA